MFKPTTGDILRGVRAGLEQSVLPELTSGGAQRQMKAALHILRRLERSWDRLPNYLATENHDIRSTLQEILSILDRVDALDAGCLARMQRRLYRSGFETFVACDRLAESNIELQELVIDLDSTLRGESRLEAPIRRICLNALSALYTRMIDREMSAWGTVSGEER